MPKAEPDKSERAARHTVLQRLHDLLASRYEQVRRDLGPSPS